MNGLNVIFLVYVFPSCYHGLKENAEYCTKERNMKSLQKMKKQLWADLKKKKTNGQENIQTNLNTTGEFANKSIKQKDY